MFSICALVVAIIAVVFTFRSTSRSRVLFRQLVVDPIPTSVRHIRADRCYETSHTDRLNGLEQNIYALRFEISKEDLVDIVAAGGFSRAESIEYSNGVLDYNMSGLASTGMLLYWGANEEPMWFDLGEWSDFGAYYTGEEKRGIPQSNVSLLLYNDALSCAYFIKHELRPAARN